MRCCVAILVFVCSVASAQRPYVVGSKLFNESVILGEIVTQLGLGAGEDVVHERQFGGSAVLFNALVDGKIDAYPEYTGTLRQELLADAGLEGDEALVKALAELGIAMSAPLGFNNTYAIGVRRETADRLGLRTIEDLRDHPGLVYGLTNEFIDRGDGWGRLSAAYRLDPERVRGMQHELAYRGLLAGSVDVVDLYSTDAEIELYDLVALEDELGFFPRYDAVVLYRAELRREAAGWIDQLEALGGEIDASAMVAMNRRAKAEDVDESEIADAFLASNGSLNSEATRSESWQERLARTTVQHVFLVAIPMCLGAAVAIPLGVAAAAMPRFGQVVVAIVGVAQTIPSLALLVLFIPLLGIGAKPAIAALFVYCLLPMVRSTQAGLASIPQPLIESARAIGLTPGRRLVVVELPLAARAILAGVKTSMVITIGFATLGAFIGAGGYGEPILTGIRRNDFSLIVQGAAPAAALALVAQGFFEILERLALPRGLRRVDRG
ncbi:MAG: amino acid ABC transporter permease [Phycisphaerae bacterium]|nr:amino acid ABC transporter permease [Phycisphaerae bacterium]